MNLIYVFLLIFAVRLASVFIVQTYYVPDEYWQSLEVAHKIAFGYGYLTWEWIQGIRSYIYPGIIACVYKALQYLKLDNVVLLITVPRILQALLTAYSDYRFFIWTGKRKWALFLTLVQWFWFYIGSRTLANTLETSLTTIALSYFSWHHNNYNYLWIVALCCFVRPTAVVVWIPLLTFHILSGRNLRKILPQALIIGTIVSAACIALDSYLHGKLIVTPLGFLKFNIVENIGTFYGSNPWHWYFSIGLPTILGINLLPFMWGTIETLANYNIYLVRKQLLVTILFSLTALSFIQHKEFRFIAFLLPLCTYISADSLTRWSYNASRGKLWTIAFLIFFCNISPALYLSRIHQRGPIDTINKLQNIAHEYRDENNRTSSILFLMPCHSTPYYSHIHENITMNFLTCQPNFQAVDNYKDEADKFFNSPVHWLRSHIPSHPRSAMPSHVVLFDSLPNEINEFLLNYKELHRVPHSEVNTNVTPKFLLNEWLKWEKEIQFHFESLFQFIRGRHGKNILIYQRLRTGEENTYNRDEYEPHTQHVQQLPATIVEDSVFNENDEYESNDNMFN